MWSDRDVQSVRKSSTRWWQRSGAGDSPICHFFPEWTKKGGEEQRQSKAKKQTKKKSLVSFLLSHTESTFSHINMSQNKKASFPQPVTWSQGQLCTYLQVVVSCSSRALGGGSYSCQHAPGHPPLCHLSARHCYRKSRVPTHSQPPPIHHTHTHTHTHTLTHSYSTQQYQGPLSIQQQHITHTLKRTQHHKGYSDTHPGPEQFLPYSKFHSMKPSISCPVNSRVDKTSIQVTVAQTACLQCLQVVVKYRCTFMTVHAFTTSPETG